MPCAQPTRNPPEGMCHLLQCPELSVLWTLRRLAQKYYESLLNQFWVTVCLSLLNVQPLLSTLTTTREETWWVRRRIKDYIRPEDNVAAYLILRLPGNCVNWTTKSAVNAINHRHGPADIHGHKNVGPKCLYLSRYCCMQLHDSTYNLHFLTDTAVIKRVWGYHTALCHISKFIIKSAAIPSTFNHVFHGVPSSLWIKAPPAHPKTVAPYRLYFTV
jgi:hypothetical protein